MDTESCLFEKIENLRKTVQRELSNGKTNFTQPVKANENVRSLSRWKNLLKSKVVLFQILEDMGDQKFPAQNNSDRTSLTTAILKNVTEGIHTNQLEANKLKLAALSSIITKITVNKEEQHEKLLELIQKKHELELQVEELSTHHSQVLEKIIEAKKELIQETDNYEKMLNNDEQRLKEMKEHQPSTVTVMKNKTQDYINKVNTARNFISTIIIAGETNLIERPELADLLIKQRTVITLDNIKN